MSVKIKGEILNLKNSLTKEDFLEVLERASNSLDSNIEYLNKINIFPVADGDTGSNMAYTLKATVKSLESEDIRNLEEMGKLTTKSFLINSRGNSGTILAQFFKGFCTGFGKEEKLNLKILKECFLAGYVQALKSFTNPQSGTILDIFECSQKVFQSLTEQVSLEEAFEICLKESKIALENTKKTMLALKKVEIVDSGAAGFIIIIKAFLEVIQNDFTSQNINFPQVNIQIPIENDLTYQFCTECILIQKGNFQVQIQQIISGFGDSLQIIEDNDLLKIHIHTNKPQEVNSALIEYGSIENFKVEDMLKMNFRARNSLHANDFSKVEPKNKLSIITDTSCNIPEGWLEEYSILFAEIPVYLPTGDQENLSKKYSLSEFYQKMEKDEKFNPKTSKVNNQTFVDLIKKALETSENVLILPISSQMSGTYDSALLAKKEFENNSNIYLMDTKTSGPGLGILIKEAFEYTHNKLDLSGLIPHLESIIPAINIYFVVENAKFLQRAGRLSASKSIIAQLLRLQPILTVNLDGKIVPDEKNIVFSNQKKKINSLFNKIQNFRLNSQVEEVFIVYSGQLALNQANILKNRINHELSIFGHKIHLLELNSVIGAHVGPGTLGIIFH